jgi:HK97 family phage prohead protease
VVLARLGDRGLSQVSTRTGPHVVEARLWSGAELRAASDGGLRVVGYASTYDRPYSIYGGPDAGGFDEVIKAGAFAKSVRERDDVRLLVNHDGVPLARTKSGTMALSADEVGLLVDAQLDAGSPIVAGLRSAMERGDMDQMSFAFEVTKQRWSADYTVREITEVRLFDVSVVTYPANAATMAMIADDGPADDGPDDVAGRKPDDVDDYPKKGRSLRLARADWELLVG